VAKSQKPDFGKSGRLTIRTNENGALVNVSAGEHITCELKVKGAVPLFAFGCQHRPIWSGPDFPGHPKNLYQWEHFTQAGDADAPSDVYSLTLSFLGATSYTFVMRRVDAAGAPLQTLKDVDYQSTTAADVFRDVITLFIS